MSTPEAIPTPEWEDVRQIEFEYEPQVVPVRQQGIAHVQSLPAKTSAMHTYTFDQLQFLGQPFELIPADPRIKAAWITSTGANCVVGTREQVMKTGTPDGFQMPANFPMRWEGFDNPLFAVATGSPSGTISIRLEYWAD